MIRPEALVRTVQLCRDLVAPGVGSEEVYETLCGVHVTCVADERNLGSHAGQTALVSLACLLLRMGMRVEVAVPSGVALIGAQPPLGGGGLRDALISAGAQMVPGGEIGERLPGTPDLMFSIGDTPPRSPAGQHWSVTGGEWSGRIIEGQPGPRWEASLPVGAMVSAALAAAEAFKFAIRRLPVAEGRQEEVSAAGDAAWDFGEVRLGPAIGCGNVDFISAGAIVQAALFALSRVQGVQLTGRIWDPDVTDISNLNRNMLSLLGDVGAKKAALVSARVPAGLALAPVEGRFPEGAALAPTAIAGVDHIPSRWTAQRASTGWLAVGGTSHLNACSSEHLEGEPCAGCLHPTAIGEDTAPIPTVSFVSFWAGLATAVRLLRYVSGVRYGRRRQHLWVSPLRMDENGGMWLPIAPAEQCPVGCGASAAIHRGGRAAGSEGCW